MADFKDKVVLVTGGASGIGFLMGKRSLKEGAAHLIIWDINEDQLLLAADTLSKEGFSVFTQLVDISDADSVVEAATRVLSDFEGIDFLFNNAGVVVGKPFHTQNSNDIARTMRINAEGMMYVTNAFLPAMIQAKSGHIINITSAAGLLPNPGMTVYSASKWAVVGWSESLRLELRKSNSPIKVLNVMPGYINTGMFKGVTPPLLMPLLEPEVITAKIIKAVKKDKIHLKEPFLVKLTTFLRGILPTSVFDALAGGVFKVYHSMDTFVGHDHE